MSKEKGGMDARKAFDDFIEVAPKVVEMKIESYGILSTDELDVLMEKNELE